MSLESYELDLLRCDILRYEYEDDTDRLVNDFLRDYDVFRKQKRIEEIRKDLFENSTDTWAFNKNIHEYYEVIEDIREIYEYAKEIGIDYEIEQYLERF
jgi:hypothetical protein